jgi:hypothetical protein
MPVEGFKSVTIPEETYKQLEIMADRTHRSIPKLIEYLLEVAKIAKEA